MKDMKTQSSEEKKDTQKMWVGVPWKGAFMREEHSFTYPSVSM
jgi:hypothetical protein